MMKSLLSCALLGAAALSGVRGDGGCTSANQVMTDNSAGLFVAVLTQLGDNEMARMLLEEIFATSEQSPKYTFLVPRDDVLSAATADADMATVEQVVLTHVITGQYRSTNTQTDTPIATLSGTELVWYEDPFGVGVDGSNMRANVTTADLDSCAGPVQIIDAVLIPGAMAPAPAPEMMPMMGPEMAPGPAMPPLGPCENVVDALSRNEDTMALARMAAAVFPDETISLLTAPDANTTVFAPPQGMLLRLLGGYQEQMVDLTQVQDILALHIVPQFLDAEELAMMDGEMLMTLAAMDELTVMVEDDGISLMSGNTTAMVTMADVDACSDSQVIHMIDMVLQPEGEFIDVAAFPPGDLGALEDALAPAPGTPGDRGLPPTAAPSAAFATAGKLAAAGGAALALMLAL